MKLLSFESGENPGQQIEIARRFLDRMHDAEYFGSHGKREQPFNRANHDHCQTRIGIGEIRRYPPDQHCNGGEGQYQRQYPVPRRERLRWRRGPAGELIGINACAVVVPEHGELFAQFEHGAKFVDSFMPCDKPRCVGGSSGHGFQPRGQPLFASARPRRGQQFEQAGPPEQIEIRSIGVMRIDEPRAVFSSALPAVFESRDPTFIESNRAPDAIPPLARFGPATTRARRKPRSARRSTRSKGRGRHTRRRLRHQGRPVTAGTRSGRVASCKPQGGEYPRRVDRRRFRAASRLYPFTPA